MKRIFLILLFSLLATELYADAGNCVRYEIGITLLNDEYIQGYVFKGGYNPIFDFKELSFKDYVLENCLYQENKLSLFLNIRELVFPNFSEYKRDCDFRLNAASPMDLRKIDPSNIKEVKLIEFNICHKCDKYDLEEGFYWNGIHPIVITELVDKEIDLLQTKPIATNSFQYRINEYATFYVLSYNDSIDSESLKNLCNKFLMSLESDFDNNDLEMIEAKYDSFKKALRKKDVIIFQIGFAV